MSKHIKALCIDKECDGNCNLCCLFLCSVCGGAESSLTKECCGYNLAYEVLERVSQGKLDYYSGEFHDKCKYDTDNDGDCHLCCRKGGCKSIGGPFVKLK